MLAIAAIVAVVSSVVMFPGIRAAVSDLSATASNSLKAGEIGNPPDGLPNPKTASTAQGAAETSVLSAPSNIIGSGYVVAPRSLLVKSEIAGRVKDLAVEVGDHIESGEPVAWLDTTKAELNLAIEKSQVELSLAQVAVACAEIDMAKAPLVRLEKLAEKKVVAQSVLEDAKLKIGRLAKNVVVELRKLETAQLRVRQAEDQISRHTIRAPFDAVVVERPAVPGMLLSSGEESGPNEAALMALIDISELYIDVDVAERHIGGISAGQAVQVRLDAYPNRVLDARVMSINPRASREKGTISVRSKFTTEDLSGVLPNMAAKVTFVADGPHIELSATDPGRRN